MIEETFQSAEPFRPWREELLERTLLIGSVLGLIALVPGLVAARQEGSLLILIADAAVYIVWVVLFLCRRMAYRLRASLLVATVLFLGVFLLFAVGLNGASFVWLMAPVLLSVLFLSPRMALATGAIIIVALATCTLLLLDGTLGWEQPPWIWATVVGNYIAVAAFLATATSFLHSRMEEAIRSERARSVERELLVSEIHHRVKNNLQTMVSLLRIQTQTTDDVAVRDALAHAELRVVSVAVAHHLAYQEEHYGTVPADEIVRQVASACVRAAGTLVEPVVSGEGGRIDASMAAPFALVLAETIALVLECTEDDCDTPLEVTMHDREGNFVVSISGCAMAADTSLPDDLQIIHALCDQLGGRFEAGTTGSTLLELTVPAVYN